VNEGGGEGMQRQSLKDGYFGKTIPQLLLLRMVLYGTESRFGQFASALLAVAPPKLLTALSLLLGQAE